jgi:hypothetical protein
MSNKKYTVDEALKICRDYQELYNNRPYGYGYYPSELIETCERLKAFGVEWGDTLTCNDFKITKGDYYITNSATKYKPDPDAYYVHWDNGNIGQLQFVNRHIFTDGFNEFLEKLRSYNPVDWDPYNCHIVYDVENGKKVMADYPQIFDETRKKANEVMRQERIKELEYEMEKLKNV